MNNINKTILTKAALALSAVMLTVSASAATVAPKPAPAGAPAQAQRQHAPRGPLTISYYAGDPAQGGKLIKTVTVQPPVRGAAPDRAAPQGAPKAPQAGLAPQGQAPQGKPDQQGKPGQPPRNGAPDQQQGQGKDEHGKGGRGGHGRHGHRGGGFEMLKAQAPAGATYAVIKDDQGQSHTIDLTKAPAQGMGKQGMGKGGPQGQQPQAPAAPRK